MCEVFLRGGGGENFRLDFKRIIHGEKGRRGTRETAGIPIGNC